MKTVNRDWALISQDVPKLAGGIETNKTLIVVAGPTAVGKTAIAIELAQRLGTEIISADSRQCYQEMNIGTAKPSAAELDIIHHYFIDVFPVTTPLAASDFEQSGLIYLEQVFKSHDTAILCGGTGLYIKALCDGLDKMPDINKTIYDQVNKQYRKDGINWLREAIEKEDPEFYKNGEIHNPARMLRALIFKRTTGKSITLYQTGSKKNRPFKIVKIGLELPRELLYQRINDRVDQMMEHGLLDEAKKLYPLKHLKNLQTVGYTELFDFLNGKSSLENAVSQIKQNTRHYAKRQMTWFKKDKEINWFMADEKDIVSQISNLIIKKKIEHCRSILNQRKNK